RNVIHIGRVVIDIDVLALKNLYAGTSVVIGDVIVNRYAAAKTGSHIAIDNNSLAIGDSTGIGLKFVTYEILVAEQNVVVNENFGAGVGVAVFPRHGNSAGSKR